MTRVEINKRLVAINAMSSVLARLVSVGVLIWANQYLLRRLAPEEYEVYPIVVALAVFLQIFTSTLTGGIARYVTEAYAKGDVHRVTEIVSSMMPLIAGGALGFLLLGGVATWQIDALLTIDASQVSDARQMMGILVGVHAFVLISSPFMVGVQVRQKFVWLNVLRLGCQLLQMGALFVLLFGVSTRVLWVVVASQGAEVVTTLCTIVYSRRLIPELRFDRKCFKGALARKLTSFGGWTMLGTLVHRIRTSADVIILNKFSTPVQVNAFHVGMLPDRQMDAVISMASVTMQPALTAMHATERHDSLANAYLRGNRYYLWLTLAVAVPLLVYCRELVNLYLGEEKGELYGVAALVLAMVCVRYPVNYATYMLYFVAMAKARVQHFFLVVTGSGISHVAITIVLVGPLELGAAGVAYASVFSAALAGFGFLWPLGLKLCDLPFGRYFRETIVPGMTPALIGTGAALLMAWLLPPLTWTRMGICVFVCLAAYGLAMLACLRPEDRRDLAPLLKRLKGLVLRRRSA